VHSGLYGQIAGDNPWNAWTLEWATTSPPPEHNFDALPPINSRRPLWDYAHPENPDSAKEHTPDYKELRIHRNTVMMYSFIASEAVFFILLLCSYVVLNPASAVHANKGFLNLPKTGMFTVALLASSATLWRAEVALHRKNRSGFLTWLFVTIALGVIFLGGQGLEYADLFKHGLAVNTSVFGAGFFTVTGFHGLHVLCGLISLCVLWGMGRAGDFDHGHEDVVIAAGLYWHFVDVVWIFVFGLLYLRAFL
jgi:cytochrome c oxidase subunit 1/cytochrome c oxidase subunit I+III